MKKHDPVRWTAERAATEFGLNPRTVNKRLRSLGQLAGADGRFSTKEIAAAVFGDMEGERLRETRAKADSLELDNQRKRAELVEVAAFTQKYHKVYTQVRQVIMNSKLVEADKHDLLLALSELHSEPAVSEGQPKLKPAKGKKVKK